MNTEFLTNDRPLRNALRRSSFLKHTLLVVIILLAAALPHHARGFEDLGSFDENRARLIAHLVREELGVHHFTHKKIDDAFSQDAFGLYLKQLDPQKRYLLAEDVESLSRYARAMDDELNTGKVRLAALGDEILKKRVAAVLDMIRELLAEDFDFSTKEVVETDPKKLSFCSTTKELKERWRQILTYQVLIRYLDMLEGDNAAGGKEGEKEDGPLRKPPTQKDAREKLLKNYESIYSKILHEKAAEGYYRYFDAIAKAFDPHTDFMPPSNKEEFDISMKGSLEGIGATLREEEGFIKVVGIVPGSPAYRDGSLQPDDIILKVAEKDKEPVDITDMELSAAVRLIRGKKGTEVRLTVRKPDGKQLLIALVRDVIQLEEASVRGSLLKDEGSGKTIGYIKVPSFYRDFERSRRDGPVRNVTDDIRGEIKKFASAGVGGLVLDLRSNGGGALTDAIRTAGLFIKTGPVVQIKGSGGAMSVLEDNDPEVAYAGPLVVLTNKLSASASEIVAGALQDYGRAVIMGGEHTHGKGTVQTIVDLDNRIPFGAAEKYRPLGALRLTTQKFYRVTGASTQNRGIIPDIVVPDRFGSLRNEEEILDFALPWDTVSPVPYDKWDGASADIGALRRQSASRVAANKEFSEIEAANRRLRELQQKTLQSLNIDVVRKERREAKADRMAAESEGHGRMKDVKGQREVLSKEERLERWHKELKEDPYVQEGMAVLLDMLSRPTAAAGN